jgi:hypothetical protein
VSLADACYADPLAELKPFVEALRFDRSEGLRLGPDAVRRAPGVRDPGEQLRADLTLCTYERAYARGFPAAPTPAGEGADIAERLAEANDTAAREEDGWKAVQVQPDGTVTAERNGRRMAFRAGRYLSLDGVAPPRTGSPLRVSFPSGSARLQPGFHHCFGTAPRDPLDPSLLIRFYLNVRLAHAPVLVRSLTSALNKYEIPFELKVTTRAEDFDRRDNGVLYVVQDLYRVTALALASVLPGIRGGLLADVPLFTKPLAAGIGLAEDPGGRESFGSSRCALVASALLAAREDEGFSYDAFKEAFRRLAAEQGLDFDALWLNPGSRDEYPRSPFDGASA